jgi:hypothetical protein
VRICLRAYRDETSRKRLIPFAPQRATATPCGLQVRDFSENDPHGKAVALESGLHALPPRSTVSEKVSSEKIMTPAPAPIPSFDRAAGARILARSFYRELRENGYSPKQLLALSTELIDLITRDLQAERKGAA